MKKVKCACFGFINKKGKNVICISVSRHQKCPEGSAVSCHIFKYFGWQYSCSYLGIQVLISLTIFMLHLISDLYMITDKCIDHQWTSAVVGTVRCNILGSFCIKYQFNLCMSIRVFTQPCPVHWHADFFVWIFSLAKLETNPGWIYEIIDCIFVCFYA